MPPKEDLQLEQIRVLLEEVKQQQYKLNTDMERLMMLLQGNPLDKADTGLIGEVADHAADIKKLKNFKEKGMWAVWLLTSAGSWPLFDQIRKFLANH